MSISSGSKILASDVSGKIDTAGTGLSKSGTTLSLATCVTAGNAGPTANASPAHGGSFTVPYITYDAYGRITGRTNRKITLPAAGAASAKAYITETYSSGTSWYRVWSDGWIEQGGKITSSATFTLPTPFSTTNYICLATGIISLFTGNVHIVSYSKTNLSIKMTGVDNNDYTNNGVFWYACGY